jgi:hypothetical protein
MLVDVPAAVLRQCGSFCTQNGFYQNYLPRRARRR